MISDVIESISSIYMLALGKLCAMLFFMMVGNHFIACCWYALSEGIENHSATWVGSFRQEYDDPNDSFIYTTALHWSLTQFTAASMEVYPRNVWERVFNIVVVLVALVAFTQLLGIITSTMTELRQLDSEETRTRMRLRQYLGHKQISTSLNS